MLASWFCLLAALVFLAGCGESDAPARPGLPSGLAERITDDSERISERLERNDPCAAADRAARLQRSMIAAVNAGRVAAELQEELLGTISELVETIPCGSSVDRAARAREARTLSERLAAYGR